MPKEHLNYIAQYIEPKADPELDGGFNWYLLRQHTMVDAALRAAVCNVSSYCGLPPQATSETIYEMLQRLASLSCLPNGKRLIQRDKTCFQFVSFQPNGVLSSECVFTDEQLLRFEIRRLTQAVEKVVEGLDEMHSTQKNALQAGWEDVGRIERALNGIEGSRAG